MYPTSSKRDYDEHSGVLAPRLIGETSTKKRALSERTSSPESQRSGRWSPDEKLLFLHGLKVFGKGRWKKIRTFLPTRTLIQIKSHAQKVVKRDEAGDDIFAPLKANKSRIEALVKSQVELSEKKSKKAQATAAYNERPISIHRTGTANAPMHLLSSCATRDDRFRFTVGGQQERHFVESTVFRATLGGSTVLGRGVSFAFSPAGELRHESPTLSTMSSKSHSAACDVSNQAVVCLTPERKVDQRFDVMAAEALCGLSGVAPRKKRNADHPSPYMVSP